MAFAIPTLADLAQRVRNAFRAELPGSDAWLWPNNVSVSAKVFAGAIWELFGRLAWIDRQRFAATADGNELERHGLEYGIGRLPAAFASGYVEVPCVTPYSVPVGEVFTRSDGAQFTATSAVGTLVSAVVGDPATLLVPVLANVAGKAGNTIAGSPVSTGLTGLTGAVYVSEDGVGGGADIETDDSLRERILFRKRQPPMGGAEYDYVSWARTIPGVTRVFVSGNAFGRGTVGVWIMTDDTTPFGIPTAGDVAAVQAYLDTVKPVTATVVVQAPVADCIEVVVQGLSRDATAVREAVAAELQSVFRRMGTVGLPGKPFTLHRSWLWSAVSNATGEEYHTIQFPTTDLVFPTGVLPCLSSVRFAP